MRITILLCFIHVIVAQIEHGPFNTAVVVGSTVSMTCGNNSNESTIKWNVKKPDELGERSVFDGSRALGGFTFDVSTNNFTVDVVLTKKSIQMEDARIYKCFIIRPDQMEVRTAQLTVLATHPKCGTNKSSEGSGILEGTYVNMWCNVSFAGDLVPIMKWSRSDGKKFEGTFENSSGYISYAISEELKAEDNGKIYSCTTYFDPINSTDALQSGVTRARNAPNYKYQWSFTADVWAQPKNLYVEPLKEWYNYGNRLRCWSDVNTTLTYRWVSVTTGIVTYGPYLSIDDTLAQNVLHVFKCIAKHEKLHTNISKAVNITIRYKSEQSAYGFNKNTLLAIFLPIGAVFIALNLGIILQKRYIRRNALKMNRQGRDAVHDYDEVDESAIKADTSEVVTAEPTISTIGLDEENSNESVSQNLSSRPYSKLLGVREVPHPPVYSILDTTSTSAEEIERSGDSPTIEVHYVNVPTTETATDDEPVYVDFPENE